ncbi:hypothetical protein JYU34_001152 [Plutella xylostella]|uniref:Alpha-1,3-mannosyl-glycoprotein 2-beta-N-acetylglucosaminyltransferase n=1 Tax=Plutella xylostella TaxID=51655 RepID=A0ABQ7R650_PLUXY|nr:hypothetical protein JYU34_001152 [Plutella xylostella]
MSFKRINYRRITTFLVIFVLVWMFLLIKDIPKPLKDVRNKLSAAQKYDHIDKEAISQKVDLLFERVSNELEESNRLLLEVQQKLLARHGGGAVRESPKKPVLPVLVVACNRVTVRRCLEQLVKHRPDPETFPIIVSQDCGHNATYQVIKSFVDSDPSISVVLQPNQSDITVPKKMRSLKGYYKIARHYKFALDHVLVTLGHEAVIIVEDDLDISPDFFEYFLGTYPLLSKDPTLWCISAWNDNGKQSLIDLASPGLLHRTQFFPGLGWLLRSGVWGELRPVWPEAFFDDWLRDPAIIKSRSCIRPEISRTYSFGKVGVSKGQYFENHLRHMQLNTQFVHFTKLNLTYLLKENYDRNLRMLLPTLVEMTAPEVKNSYSVAPESVIIIYDSVPEYTRAAKALGLMDDLRGGIPRTGYEGIVTCFIKGRRVYLVPRETLRTI